MAIELPTRTDLARYSFEIELDAVTYSFAFEWNDRDSGWYMSLSDADGVPLISGRRVVLDTPLTILYAYDSLPRGNIVAIDTSNTGEEPGFGDLGERVKLVYLTAEESGA